MPTEEIRREDDAAVGQPDLTVLDRVHQVVPCGFQAVGVVRAQPGGDHLVVVVIAKGPIKAKFTNGQPIHHERLRIELVVKLRRADAQLAQIVADHRHVIELACDSILARFWQDEPAEEFVRCEAIINPSQYGN